MKNIKAIIKKKFSFFLPTYQKINRSIFGFLVRKQFRHLAKKINFFYALTKDTEVLEVLKYLEANELQIIPYEFTKKFDLNSIVVNFDNSFQLPYVVYEDKLLNKKHNIYFPKTYSTREIQHSFAIALMEQHEKSPHRYLTETFNIIEGDTAIIAGASDCVFCISIINKFKKIYLFEPESKWVESMKATLLPYESKVEIINKYISDVDSNNEIRLDTFFAGENEKISYIQADIEGAEAALLIGAINVFKTNKDIKASLCCYHTHHQQQQLIDILNAYGLTVEHSYGYMILWPQYPLKKPYLRRGVIYAKR